MPRIGHDYSGFSYSLPVRRIHLRLSSFPPPEFLPSPFSVHSNSNEKEGGKLSFSRVVCRSRRRISNGIFTTRFGARKIIYPGARGKRIFKFLNGVEKDTACGRFERIRTILSWQVETRRGNKCREFLFGAKDFQINVFSERRVIKALPSFLRSCPPLSLSVFLVLFSSRQRTNRASLSLRLKRIANVLFLALASRGFFFFLFFLLSLFFFFFFLTENAAFKSRFTSFPNGGGATVPLLPLLLFSVNKKAAGGERKEYNREKESGETWKWS